MMPTDLSEMCDVRKLGIAPDRITRARLIRRKHGSSVYRLECERDRYVLKCFSEAERAVEIRAYALLNRLGVPTLPVLGETPDAILLEDLDTSRAWRLATEEDVARADTGAAVARWYKALHEAGSRLCACPSSVPRFLRREADELSGPGIVELGRRLGLAADPVWGLAADSIDVLTRAMRSLDETLNYNDFHWVNLALSRSHEPRLRAIVFDYHLLGIGPAYSDFRNAIGSLGPAAAAAFKETYGPCDAKAAAIDAPVSLLYALQLATNRSTFPRWGENLLQRVRNGDLERGLLVAMEAVRTGRSAP